MLNSKKLFLLAAMTACILTGCGNSDRAKLIGRWAIAKPERVMSRIAQDSVEQEAQTSDSDSAEPKMLVVFHASGVVETKTAMGTVDQQKRGTWKMMSYDGTTQSMTISCEINGQTSEHAVAFVDEETIELVPPNMAGLTTKIKFNRQ